MTVMLGGTLTVPAVAAAAPAPCERADRYAAQSGAEFLHVDRLDWNEGARASDVGLAEAKSALVGEATVNSAAVTRLVSADRPPAYANPLMQQAPPTNDAAVRRSTDSGAVGPFALGDGTLTAHARWDPRMACARTAGEVTRADARLAEAGIGTVLRVPREIGSRSTTALTAGGRTVATSLVGTGGFDLLDGAVHVDVLRPPSLTAQMSTKDGGEIRYVPAVLKVSGDDIRTTRLDTPGDELQLAVDEDRMESAVLPPSTTDKLSGAGSLSLPAVPGLPLPGADESTRISGPGTRLRIALGRVRQAAFGHAIAAKATAIRVSVTRAPDSPDRYGGDGPEHGGITLDVGVGRLEAAAVAPEPGQGRVSGAVSASGVGAGGGLPITGPPVDVLAIGGALLLAVGAVAVFCVRRRFRPW